MDTPQPPPTLQLTDVIANPLVLDHILPYLSAFERLRLASTSKHSRWLLYQNTHFFRHLDLGTVKTINFRVKDEEMDEFDPNAQVREYLTEDDFMSGPIRGIFNSLRRANFLADIQTLILDGLPVTADVCHEILTGPHFNVRILSLRGVTSLNERKLCAALRTSHSSLSHPKRARSLKGIYIFGAPDSTDPAADDAATLWYRKRGQVIQRNIPAEWGRVLHECRDILAFDSVLCKGPAHANSPVHGCYDTRTSSAAPWAVAKYSLGRCAGCGSAPEGLTYCDRYTAAADLPMLSPPPLLASTVRTATTPCAEGDADLCFVARCEACVQGRMCRCCNAWYCEDCYPLGLPASRAASPALSVGESVASSPLSSSPASISSFTSAMSAISLDSSASSSSSVSSEQSTKKRCHGCGGGYCFKHHEGSSDRFCDWCHTRRHTRRGLTTATTPASPIGLPAAAYSSAPGQQRRSPRQHTEAWSRWMSQQRGPMGITARPMRLRNAGRL